MKSKATVSGGKICCDSVWLYQREAFYPNLIEGVCGDWFVELSISSICPINWLKGN
jgi:hypothetical protein